MIENSVVDVVGRVEVELERLKEKRPALRSRVERAEHIIVIQLSVSNGLRPIRVRLKSCGGHVYEVRSGSKLRRCYEVDPNARSCTCPDYSKRGAVCKHGIACYALGRAFERAAA